MNAPMQQITRWQQRIQISDVEADVAEAKEVTDTSAMPPRGSSRVMNFSRVR